MLTQLNNCTNRILDAAKSDYAVLYAACQQLYDTLVEQTGIDDQSNDSRSDLLLENGNAIGLTWAALCIKDIMRTKRFMDGVYEAVSDMVKCRLGQPIHILYAGTGPFATLVLPLVARFSSSQIQFTLLDVNEHSLHCLRRLWSQLQLEHYVHSMVLADACTWKIPAGENVDIVISETMRRGLRAEPQVAIFCNLVPQLPPHAVVIPQQVTLKAALLKGERNLDSTPGSGTPSLDMDIIGEVFSLSKHSIVREVQHNGPDRLSAHGFPGRFIELPNETAGRNPLLYLLTEIDVYKQENLRMNESSLTMPLHLGVLPANMAGGISFQYMTGAFPEMHWTLQPAE